MRLVILTLLVLLVESIKADHGYSYLPQSNIFKSSLFRLPLTRQSLIDPIRDFLHRNENNTRLQADESKICAKKIEELAVSLIDENNPALEAAGCE